MSCVLNNSMAFVLALNVFWQFNVVDLSKGLKELTNLLFRQGRKGTCKATHIDPVVLLATCTWPYWGKCVLTEIAAVCLATMVKNVFLLFEFADERLPILLGLACLHHESLSFKLLAWKCHWKQDGFWCIKLDICDSNKKLTNDHISQISHLTQLRFSNYTPLTLNDLPLRFAASLISNQPDVSNFTDASFSKEHINLFLISLHVDARYQHCAVISLGFLSLLLRLFNSFYHCIFLLFFLVCTLLTRTTASVSVFTPSRRGLVMMLTSFSVPSWRWLILAAGSTSWVCFVLARLFFLVVLIVVNLPSVAPQKLLSLNLP